MKLINVLKIKKVVPLKKIQWIDYTFFNELFLHFQQIKYKFWK
jgi:hypothetical protein